ncbi:type 2 periplasmic-binding domain-containing protein [Aurantivibrio plasticivorans]
MKYLIIILTLIASAMAQAEIAVIVSSDSPITAADVKALERVYLGKANQIDGKDVEVINQGDGEAVTTEFNRVVLNKSNSQVKAYWSKLVFTGKGSPPNTVNNDAEVIAAVKADPRLVGYIDSAAVTPDVKVVATLK